jgi:hypothetical protein
VIRVAAAALVLVLLGGANGCCACAASKTFERRSAAASAPKPAVTLTPPVTRVLHFGDFGEPTCQQAAVAAAIADAQQRKPFDVAFHAGDNLYPCGPDWHSTQAARCTFAADGNTVAPGYSPPSDPIFHENFEDALGSLIDGGVPIYLSLGNHDVSTWTSCLPIGDPVAVARAKACLEVAHSSPGWKMPARHYFVDQGPARFIVLDTEVVGGDYAGGFTLADEIAFLTAASAGCDARPCFVVTHHPAASAGLHDSDFIPAYAARMQQLVAAAGGNLRGWLAGHDHDLQHLRTAGGLDVFISGNGCRHRTDERFEQAAPAGATLEYATIRWGFAILEVSATGFTWRVEDERGDPRYCCAATLSGTWSRCDPVVCN